MLKQIKKAISDFKRGWKEADKGEYFERTRMVRRTISKWHRNKYYL